MKIGEKTHDKTKEGLEPDSGNTDAGIIWLGIWSNSD